MNEEEFSKKIMNLAFLIGVESGEDIFPIEYKNLLDEVNAAPGPRYERLARLKTLLLSQSAYLIKEWLQEVSEPCAGSA